VDPAAEVDQAAGPARTAETHTVTAGGVLVTRTAEPIDEQMLGTVCTQVEGLRGGVLSSGMEYPGRYSRWHLAYVNPCAELVARGRRISARALNARGEVLLPVLGAALLRVGEPVAAGRAAGEVEVVIPEPAGVRAEEDRSRRPTVFSALREVITAMAGEDPHLGLYGAFGYDLAFQFEPVELRHQRPGEQRDLVLHLPDELYVHDRKRETATRYRYDFAVAGVSTHGLPARRLPPRWWVPQPEAWGTAARAARPGALEFLCPHRRAGPGASPAATCSRSSPATFHAPCASRPLLPAAAAAQAGALRVLLQPRRGRVPGRRVTRDVCQGDGRPGGDLPDLRHDRRGTDPPEDAANIRALLNRLRRSRRRPCAPTWTATTSRGSACRAACGWIG
jgi:anthranilate synthase